MTQAKPTIRLYVPGDYAPGRTLTLSKNQSHYTVNVMRALVGDGICIFNGKDGEWVADISGMDKKNVALTLVCRHLEYKPVPDVWLVFAPIKHKTDGVVEKATELGVSKIIMVPTMHGVVKSVNMEKMTMHAIEAAEQCERHDVPILETCRDLPALLGSWPTDRILLYGDESGGGGAFGDVLQSLPKGKYALLIGPEGGFSKQEHQMLAAAKFAKAFGMGPRILRADTAAVAALACLQSHLGNWQQRPHFKSNV